MEPVQTESSRVTRKQRKAQTRQALREAAYRCFSDGGYSGTQIGDICRAAGVAQGTFYVHFPSKEAVLEELLVDFNLELVERLRPSWPEEIPGDIRPLIRTVARTFLDHWNRHRGLVEAYAQRAALGTSIERLRDGMNPPMIALLTQALQAAADADSVGSRRLDLVVQGLLAMWLRVGLQVTFGPGRPPEEAEEVLVEMTLGALRAVLPHIGINHPDEKEQR